jgi:hypothetical protein
LNHELTPPVSMVHSHDFDASGGRAANSSFSIRDAFARETSWHHAG